MSHSADFFFTEFALRFVTIFCMNSLNVPSKVLFIPCFVITKITFEEIKIILVQIPDMSLKGKLIWVNLAAKLTYSFYIACFRMFCTLMPSKGLNTIVRSGTDITGHILTRTFL